MSVCHVSPPGKSDSLWTGDYWAKSLLIILANLKTDFCQTVSVIFLFYLDCFPDFWSLQTSLLCMVGGLAEVGSVAMAVGVSEKRQVTDDTQHVTHDT